ncbi:hemerythrin [Lampropedia cohaerens]|uniref:Hemerythrin n=1 Tax=Lampropedia cohaerens TaxID=1610491 RepID=A0A0U1Q3I3_9BURK|nr:hemerythrin domain-containing protein [Lampropedia cohaerens]KKW69297.1 hemerythrin [Lampropedia cohaerens]
MNIYEALRQSHDVQRLLADRLIETSGDSQERQELFAQLRRELAAHATAEERYFYVPLLMDDNGIDLTRHALAEHHTLDELVEQLQEIDPSSSAWLVTAKKLRYEVHHHLEEEERKFFQMSGKILDEQQKNALATQYLREFESQKQRLAEEA